MLRSITALTGFENFTLDGEGQNPHTGGTLITPPGLRANE